MLSKRYESTEVDRRTWLHVPSGTPWSTSSDTHQVVEIKRDFYSDVYTILNQIEFTVWTICAFRVLNPGQCSLAKESSISKRDGVINNQNYNFKEF